MMSKITVVRKKTKDIKEAPYNPREISEHALSGLQKSLERFGYCEPIVWNEQTGHIVGGHQRYKVLVSQGVKDVDVVKVSLSENEEKALNLTLNNTDIQGDWDYIKLDGLIQELKDFPEFESLNLPALEDLASSIKIKEEVPEDDNPIEENKVPERAKLGDVWILGKHKFFCGDSGDESVVKNLLGGQSPILCVTDPPYGVNYDPEWRENADKNVGKRSKGKVKNDDKFDWREVYQLWDAQIIYCWHAGVFSREVADSLVAANYQIVSQIIWVKQHFALSRGDYHWQHEPCWYAVRKGKPHNWQGARDQSTTWEIQNNNPFGNSETEEKWGHGTQKPIECMARPIINNSKEGDLVVDPFLGSGTTLIACEKLGRVCYGAELEPKYCDIIISRWEKETGLKAKKEKSK